MKVDPRVTELQCIMPIVNIPSVLTNGILSYERAAKQPHHSVAMQPVQEKRDLKQIPGGLKLHQYANLYFHARNPMLFKRRHEAQSLCVLRLSTAVLSIQGTVVSDQNAASDYARFLHPSQWQLIPFDDVFRPDWTHPDQITYWRRKSRKCAEVLVPGVVPPAYVVGGYAIDQVAAAALAGAGFTRPVQIDHAFFFS
jgi:ssDNA thymidine ADP-ribosyltransferase, DarT